MRKFIFSFVALTLSLSAFAAVGDKVYFVNNAGLTGDIYVGEAADGWEWLTGSNAVSEKWQYEGNDVYSYTITRADAERLYLTNSAYGGTWIKNGNDARYTKGCYYLIETDGTDYWLTEKYYNEFYFMDNNVGAIMDEAPAIVLYNVEDENYNSLNGVWATALMDPIGNVAKGEATFPGYKYVTLTDQACTHVQFVKPANHDIKTGTKAVEAGKNIYSWWEWYNVLPEVADKIYLRYATDANAEYWADEVEMRLNGEYRYEANISNFVVYTEGDYKYRAFLGSGSWGAPVSHRNNANWHESVHLTPGIYNLYYLYNPYDDTYSVDITAQYNRSGLTAGNYGTICLPRASDSWKNATFYTIAGSIEGGIELEEVTNGYLDAGRPYIFKATDSWITVWFNEDDAANAPWAEGTNGLKGSYTEQTLDNTSENLYVLSNNEFRAVGTNVKVGANRAYLDMAAVTQAPVHAPGKRYVRVGVQAKMPTSFEEVQANDQTSKRIENGHLYILKNGVRYNAQGQIVK